MVSGSWPRTAGALFQMGRRIFAVYFFKKQCVKRIRDPHACSGSKALGWLLLTQCLLVTCSGKSCYLSLMEPRPSRKWLDEQLLNCTSTTRRKIPRFTKSFILCGRYCGGPARRVRVSLPQGSRLPDGLGPMRPGQVVELCGIWVPFVSVRLYVAL